MKLRCLLSGHEYLYHTEDGRMVFRCECGKINREWGQPPTKDEPKPAQRMARIFRFDREDVA